LKRGELWWANLGEHRPLEQTGRRPVIVWQSDALNSVLQSVLVVPLTTNLDRAHLAGTAMIEASELGPMCTATRRCPRLVRDSRRIRPAIANPL
jgi:mRNA-degrading endonuclease toxin of MazEF toxin-antitoxin module